MSLSLPRLCQAPVPACLCWLVVVGGKRRVPFPRLCQPSPGLFVLAGVWWEVSGVSLSLPRLRRPQSRPVCVWVWWEVSGVPSPSPDCVSPSPGLFGWLVCGGR